MPRKTSGVMLRRRRCAACFNEAAARCRGKLLAPSTPRSNIAAASMRPRPDAAENRLRLRHHLDPVMLQ